MSQPAPAANQHAYRPPGPVPFRPFQAMRRTWVFLCFTLHEYVSAGRIGVELLVSLAFYGFFLRGDAAALEPRAFLTLTGIFLLGLTIYTTSSVLSLGDRPQGYVVLAHGLGRASYLLAHYLSALVVLLGCYGLISLLALLLNASLGGGAVAVTLDDWLLGSVPLLLNVALLAVLLLLLSPLVSSTSGRLLVLGLIALAFSGSFFGSATVDALPPTLRSILHGVQAVLGAPLVPAFSGFELAVTRDYSGTGGLIIIAQASLLLVLLSLAMYIFARRELILNTG